jgi:uncharacterized protein YjaZ
MKFNIIFIKSKGEFNKKERRKIENVIKKTANHATKLLNLRKNHLINFIVYPFDRKYIGGITMAEDWIGLTIPRKKIKKEELRSTIYHEMHHIARNFYFYTKKKFSFLDTLLSEGLAVNFGIEQVPNWTPKYSKYTNNFIKKWVHQLKKENLSSTDFSHDEWFFGKRGKPVQLGYKIGTYLVNQIKRNYPELTAEKLTKKSAKYLLKLSKVKLR